MLAPLAGELVPQPWGNPGSATGVDVHGGMQKCMKEYMEVCGGMWRYAEVHSGMQRYAELCEGMQRGASPSFLSSFFNFAKFMLTIML